MPKVGQADELYYLQEPCRDARLGFHKGGQAFGKDFPGAGGHITKEFAHVEQQTHLPSSTRQICHLSTVMTMDPQGWRGTEWAAGRHLR